VRGATRQHDLIEIHAPGGRRQQVYVLSQPSRGFYLVATLPRRVRQGRHRLSADCWSAIECLSRGDSNLSKDRSIVGMCSDGAHQQ